MRVEQKSFCTLGVHRFEFSPDLGWMTLPKQTRNYLYARKLFRKISFYHKKSREDGLKNQIHFIVWSCTCFGVGRGSPKVLLKIGSGGWFSVVLWRGGVPASDIPDPCQGRAGKSKCNNHELKQVVYFRGTPHGMGSASMATASDRIRRYLPQLDVEDSGEKWSRRRLSASGVLRIWGLPLSLCAPGV